MPLLTDLSDIFGDAFAKAGVDRSHGAVVTSQRPDLAQFQCNGALGAAKEAGRNPRELAEAVLEAITDRSPFEELSIAGPGFINIDLTDKYLASQVRSVQADDRHGVPTTERKSVIVDYGGPNVAKELHVGHLRPAIIGESVKRIFRFAGHDVAGDVHLGDWGLPMGQLIAEMKHRDPDLVYFDPSRTGPYPQESPVDVAHLNEMYPVAAAAATADPERKMEAQEATAELQAGRPGYRALWEHFRRVSIEAMREVYDSLGVHFELWNGEASVHDRIEPMVARLKANGVAVESDGALIIVVDDPDENREIPPLMLVNSRGAFTYGTSDLATVEERVMDARADEIIYVVDARQGLHFEQVFRAARKSGIAPASVVLEHAANGTVNGPGGTPLKTREGNLPLLRDLIDDATAAAAQRLDENDLASEYDETERGDIAFKVGMAALKFGDLQNHRSSDYIFDLDRFSAFEGKTGPYLLYGAVRMKSILREASDRGLQLGTVLPPKVDQSRNLLLALLRFPDVFDRALRHRAPNHLAEYGYELVAEFSRFYEACHILREPDAARQASWLSIVELTLTTLGTVLDLLGIESPERM